MRCASLDRSSVALRFPVAAILLFAAPSYGQNAPGPGAVNPQPGTTTTQGSDSQKQQPGSSSTGTQSSAVPATGAPTTGAPSSSTTTPNSTTGNTPSVGTQPSTSITTGAGSRTGNEAASPAQPTSGAVNTGTADASVVARGIQMQLAQYLVIENESKIVVAQLGRERAANAAVKQFAERMIAAHTAMVEKLRPLTGADRRPNATEPSPNSPPQASTNPDVAATNTGRSDQSANVGGVSGGGLPMTTAEITGGLDFVAVRRDLSAQFLASKRAELESKPDAEFDKCFMRMQLAMHLEAVDTLKVFRERASGELRRAIDEALPIVEDHLDQAKTTMKDLERVAAR